MLRVTTRFAAAGPKCISTPAVAVGGSEVYVFGELSRREEDSSGRMEVHVFNTMSLRWRKLPPPPPGTSEEEEVPRESFYHTAVLIDGVVYVSGGCDLRLKEYHDALRAFDVVAHRWSRPRVSGCAPPKRACHSACVSRKVMYVFGGCMWADDPRPGVKVHGGLSEDVFRLDTATMAWTSVSVRGSPPPPAYIHHGAAIVGTKMLVFGGCGLPRDCEKVLSVFDTETDLWLRTPPARLCPEDVDTSAVFAHKGELYALEHNHVWRYVPEICSWTTMEPKGKKTLELDHVWTYVPETFSWVKSKTQPEGKTALQWTRGMSVCAVGDRIVLFGRPVTYVLEFSPSLKTLCKLVVIDYGLDRSELPHDVRWELSNMTTTDSD